MTAELGPGPESGDSGCFRTLGSDEYDIAEAVPTEFALKTEVALPLVGICELGNS